MKRTCFLFALGLFVSAVPVWAQDFDLQHFRCYPVLEVVPDVEGTVELQDQFNAAPLPFELVDFKRAKRFCNPTAKFHPGLPNPFFPITDDRQHLTFYPTFPQQGPIRVAEVRNQFGLQRLILRAPVALAVPTQKSFPTPHPPPEGLDHFRCYASLGPAGQPKRGPQRPVVQWVYRPPRTQSGDLLQSHAEDSHRAPRRSGRHTERRPPSDVLLDDSRGLRRRGGNQQPVWPAAPACRFPRYTLTGPRFCTK